MTSARRASPQGAARKVSMILAQAEESGADVIVVAPHGAYVLEQAVLGSVSQSLLQAAPCPVLIVPRNMDIDDPN